MKRTIALAVFFCTFTACAWVSPESLTATPSESPVSIHTFIPIPQPSATSFVGEVSIEHAEISYYDVTGSTADELRASMNKSRPKDPYDGDRPVDSYTDWYISWNWPGYGTDACDLSAVSVTHNIKVILPRWEAPAHVASELVAKWEEYIQSLTLHEKGHVDHVLNNYSSVTDAIRSATCSTAEAEAQKALDSLRDFDANYDNETKHGETQSAVFP